MFNEIHTKDYDFVQGCDVNTAFTCSECLKFFTGLYYKETLHYENGKDDEFYMCKECYRNHKENFEE